MRPLDELARRHGVQAIHRDRDGRLHRASDEAVLAVLRALGVAISRPQDAARGPARRLRRRRGARTRVSQASGGGTLPRHHASGGCRPCTRGRDTPVRGRPGAAGCVGGAARGDERVGAGRRGPRRHGRPPSVPAADRPRRVPPPPRGGATPPGRGPGDRRAGPVSAAPARLGRAGAADLAPHRNRLGGGDVPGAGGSGRLGGRPRWHLRRDPAALRGLPGGALRRPQPLPPR